VSIRNIPQTDAAWLAGLFEGEGYLSRIPGNGVRMGINMCDEDVVRRAYELAGGSFRDKPAGSTWRDGARTTGTRLSNTAPPTDSGSKTPSEIMD
jgi:hypothetical protein